MSSRSAESKRRESLRERAKKTLAADSPEESRGSSGVGGAGQKVPWEEMYERLRAYKREHGDCMVPRHHPGKPKLGAWVQTQRSQYVQLKFGKKSTMTPERIDLLKRLDFDFEPRGEHHESWNNWLDELRRYKREFGDCQVPRETSAWYCRLGSWLHMQKYYYKLRQEGRPSCMTQERIKALEGVGVLWNNHSTDVHRNARKRKRNAVGAKTTNDNESAPREENAEASTSPKTGGCSSSKSHPMQCEDDKRLLVARIRAGTRIAVYWPADNTYYEGKVTEWRRRWDFFRVKVLYDDGDVETINLYEEIFKVLD